MRVKRNRDAHSFFQSQNDLMRNVRLQQAGHILDADRAASHVFQLLSEFNPLVRRMDRTDGEGHGSLRVFADAERGAYGGLDVPKIVHRIEYAKDVDSVCGCAFHKALDDIVGIVPVTENVLAAKQHLKRCVGHRFAYPTQPLPGVFA